MARNNNEHGDEEVAHFHTEATRARVVELYQSGHKLAAITAETGVPRATIYWILRREGIRTDRVARSNDDALSVGELLDTLRGAEQEIGRLTAELERERAITRWFLDQISVDRSQIVSAIGNVKPPARPRTRKTN